MKWLTIFWVVLIFTQGQITRIKAQDASFSQFYANRIHLNPAYAGFSPGWTLNANYRNQWYGIPDAQFKTFDNSFRSISASLDVQLPSFGNNEDMNVGLGLYFLNDEAGGQLNTNLVGFAASFRKVLVSCSSSTRGRSQDIRAGFYVAGINRRLTGDNLIFSDQIHPIDGPIEGLIGTFDESSSIYPEIGAGVIYRFVTGYLPFTVGFSLNRFLFASNESLFQDTRTYTREMGYVVHIGSTFKISGKSTQNNSAPIFLSPQAKFEDQSGIGIQVLTAGAYITTGAVFFGGFYRRNFSKLERVANNQMLRPLAANASSAIINAGVNLKSTLRNRKDGTVKDALITIGFSYDFDFGGLPLDKTFGTLEFNIRYNFESGWGVNCHDASDNGFYNGTCPTYRF